MTSIRIAALFAIVSAFGLAAPVDAAPPPSVSVGGRLYIDADRNGEFSQGDRGVSATDVVLSGPDGGPVTDVLGDPVPLGDTTDGFYSFDLLPVLEPGETYSATIPPPFGGGGALVYASAGGTPVTDQSIIVAVSGELTTAGASDSSLDFVLVYDVAFITVNSFTSSDGPSIDGAATQVLEPDTPVSVTHRVTNGGNEPLIDLSIGNRSFGDVVMGPIDCDFSEFGGATTGTSWAGPLPVGSSVSCVSQFPGMPPGSEHRTLVDIAATGGTTGEPAQASEGQWRARTEASSTPTTSTAPPTTTATPTTAAPVATTPVPSGQLPETGSTSMSTAWFAAFLTFGGALLLLVSRRRSAARA